jgi:hypothetical protein
MALLKRAKTAIVVAKADVQAILAVIRQPANSRAMQSAMTATKDVVITADLPTAVPYVVLRLELAIPQKHAPETQALVLRMQVHRMVRAVATIFNVLAVNAQVVISSAGVLWAATRELETTLPLATVSHVKSAAPVVDRTLCSETMSASRCSRTSWTVHLAEVEANVTM